MDVVEGRIHQRRTHSRTRFDLFCFVLLVFCNPSEQKDALTLLLILFSSVSSRFRDLYVFALVLVTFAEIDDSR